ncbi:MAG TPA: hypothetical protein ENL20_09360, partial [Candidatus Cloacimonetes bacterium]|nr:hypothetical protein [Candidatus Cloacimonadota bacterium]
NTIKGKPPTSTRPIPDYEFLIEPADLMFTYYDYMPGSYNGIPVCVQPEISQPNGYEAGGVYIVFHSMETSSATRKTYCCYVDSGGNIGESTSITENIWNGYPGIAIDPITANAFVAWHQQDGTCYDVFMSYDLFHMWGDTGLWREPFIVIDNPQGQYQNDEFIWPIVQIGPSPIEGKRRVYILAKRATVNPFLYPENALLAYADFSSLDLDSLSTLDWTYITFPVLDEWAYCEPHVRPYYTFTVSDDGKVAVIGNLASWDESYDQHIFVLYNDNYGEGEFSLVTEDFRFYVDNPQNQDGSYAFVNDNNTPYELYFTFVNCNHFNAVLTDDNSQIKFVGSFGLHGDDPDEEDDVYWSNLIFPKEIEFDFSTNEFNFVDLDIQGENPNDNIPMLPWDLDEDGTPDNYDNQGNVLYYYGWPIYYYDLDAAYHENYFRIVKNEEKNWLAAVWSDGLKAKLANQGAPPGYEDWLEVPEIAICISNNNGETWSEPIFLNSLETPELEGMIPCYIYPGDLIEDLGNEHGKLHLFFLDDYSYGSSIQGFGLQIGGMLKYAALDIDFGYDAAVEENDICSAELVLQSYPNPFQSETTISFNVTQTSRFVTLEIFNIKGQRIRELEIRNDKLEMNKVIWDGTDDNGKLLSSGIYL